MTEIWAGPFLGEFGWECTIWAPWLRHEQHRLQLPMHVVCERGKALLYEDFALEVHEIDPVVDLRRDCQNAFSERGAKFGSHDYGNMITKVAGHAVKCVTPIDLSVQWPGGVPIARRSRWHVMRPGKEPETPPLAFALHARAHTQSPIRNWSEENWDKLIFRINAFNPDITKFAIGSKDGAYCPHSCIDLRGRDLKNVATNLQLCKFIVGPSSGPLAFAMLCKVPAVWWSHHVKDISRFSVEWNPFKVPNAIIESSWNPDVEFVKRVCLKFL